MLVQSCRWSGAAGVDDAMVEFVDSKACNASSAMSDDREDISVVSTFANDDEPSYFREHALPIAVDGCSGVP